MPAVPSPIADSRNLASGALRRPLPGPRMRTRWLVVAAVVSATVLLALPIWTGQNSEAVATAVAVTACNLWLLCSWWAGLPVKEHATVPAWRLLVGSAASLAAAHVASAVSMISGRSDASVHGWIDGALLASAGLAVAAAYRWPWAHETHAGKTRVFLDLVLAACAAALAGSMLAARFSFERLSPGLGDWAIAAALIAIPTLAALAFVIAAAATVPPIRRPALELAAAWGLLLVAFAGAAAHRLMTEVPITGWTAWAVGPAGILGSIAAFRILRSGAIATRPAIRPAGESGAPIHLATTSWPRVALAYVVVAASAGLAALARSSGDGTIQTVVFVLALATGVLVLVRQVVTHLAEARATHHLQATTAELARQATFDLLTDLPNRRALMGRLAEEVERACRYQQPLSICYIDLDWFKVVNDRHGHDAGDQVLRDTAAVLRRTARNVDFVGRLGGEEFVVLVPGTWSGDAAVLAERLRRAIAEHSFHLESGSVASLTISVGVAGLPEHAADGASLLSCADMALYAAKRNGRNRVVLYDPGSSSTIG